MSRSIDALLKDTSIELCAFLADVLPRVGDSDWWKKLALCPICAAKYKEFVKRDNETAAVVRTNICSSEELVVPVKLGQEVGSIRFVEKHLVDVRGVLKEETDAVGVR